MTPTTRRAAIAGVGILLLAAGLMAGVGRATRGPRVDAYTAVERPIRQTLLVSGRLAAPARVELGAQVQNTVVEVLVDEGDVVEEGTLLVRLADAEAAARVREAEAQVSEAEARLRRVRGVGRKVASERVAQAQLALDDAESRFERADYLYRSGSSTEAAHDAARKDRDTARSQLVAAQLEAAATDPAGSDTAAAAASLAHAQASLDVARAGLERTRLRAPARGTVLQRSVEVGQVVRPGDALLLLAGDGPLEVRVTPDEYHLGTLAVGQSAKVVVEAFPERPLRATVERIAPQIDAARGTVEVRLALSDEVDGLSLRSDMSATVEVMLGQRDQAMVLPTWLVRDLGSGQPWVLLAVEGRAERRNVSIGLQGDSSVEVTDGLDVADAVLPPEADVGPGEPVRARSPQPSLPEG